MKKITLLLMMFFSCCSVKQQTDGKVHVLDTSYGTKLELAKDGPVVLMLSASWCPACQFAKPFFCGIGVRNA